MSGNSGVNTAQATPEESNQSATAGSSGSAGKKRPGPPTKPKAISKTDAQKAAVDAAASSAASTPANDAKSAEHLAAVEAEAARIAAKNVERNARIKALQREGKLAEIEPILNEVLHERRQSLGGSHPDTLKSISTLGRLLQVQGKLSEAQPLFEEALAGRRVALGSRHPYTLNSVQVWIGMLDTNEQMLSFIRTSTNHMYSIGVCFSSRCLHFFLDARVLLVLLLNLCAFANVSPDQRPRAVAENHGKVAGSRAAVHGRFDGEAGAVWQRAPQDADVDEQLGRAVLRARPPGRSPTLGRRSALGQARAFGRQAPGNAANGTSVRSTKCFL